MTLKPVVLEPTNLQVAENEYALYLLIAYVMTFLIGFTLSIMCYFKPHKSVFWFFCMLLMVPVFFICIRPENLQTFHMGMKPSVFIISI